MPTIRILPPELASQIAAGEVVERPASAVKELIENALDAGARRVDVRIAGGGVTLLAVSDDGSGMAEEDARLAIERHATSKLRGIDDLTRMRTFGFRGEALPSIASVSRFRLLTRTGEADGGVEITIEGGRVDAARPAAAPVGTTIEVRDLFFNVPARRKFLRATGTESAHVGDVLEGAALSRPEVTFTLERDGRRVREWLRASGRPERARAVADDDTLEECGGERGPLRVLALLSRPERARNGATGLRLLVNDRPVRDRALALTVAQAYGSVLERGRYPVGVVYLDLPPELVDVNVHPQKTEVRFADARTVQDALYGILSRTLAAAFSLPAPARSPWTTARPPLAAERVGGWGAPSARAVASPAQGALPSGGLAQPASTPLAAAADRALAAAPPLDALAAASPAGAPVLTDQVAERVETRFAAAAEPLDATMGAVLRVGDAAPLRPRPETPWASLRFVAQLRQTYLLCEGGDGFYVLDQHAASERVAFDRLRKLHQARQIPMQAMLFPLVLEVTAEEVTLVEERSGDIAALGLELRVRGPASVSVHAVPRLLPRASPERLVRDLLGELSRTGGRAYSAALDLALATFACHGALRAGDPVSAPEAAALLESLDQADFAGHCPHGRPVVTFTSWADLERKVGRR
ncbi:MAG: DNA mismatch repair endonuclease MutL [Polyangiaceae bacterium]|nr:DNA mismatch repair endonuclease MutL [Polyangiaceae bacterium]